MVCSLRAAQRVRALVVASVVLLLFAACGAREPTSVEVFIRINDEVVCENARAENECVVQVGRGGFILEYEAAEPCERVEVLEITLGVANDPSFEFQFDDFSRDVCSSGYSVAVRRDAVNHVVNNGSSAEVRIRMRTMTETFDTYAKLLTSGI